MAVPAGWRSGEEDLIPTEYSAKVAYFKKKYGRNTDSNSHLKKLFEDFDRDSDGLITLEELKMAMLNFGKDVPQTELSAIFEKVDRNKDQRIDFKEFSDLVVALETKYGKLRAGSTYQNTFEDFDKDKDGLVTLDEIRLHLLGEGKGIAENELKDLFGKADKNSDGKIDLTEFNELVELIQGKASEIKINPDLAKVFEQFDADHDGLISKDEVRSTLRAIGKDLSDYGLETCFNEADTNKDGKIDITEFSILIAKLKQVGKLMDMPR